MRTYALATVTESRGGRVHLLQRLLDLVIDLRRSHWRTHWLHLVFLVAPVYAGVVFAEYLQDNDYALSWRYPIYKVLLHATPWKARANRTAVVLIGDHEYWQVLRGQSPARPAHTCGGIVGEGLHEG